MGHNRKLVLGGVSLTTTRVNRLMFKVVDDVRNEVEDIMIKSGYLEHAPFLWIGLIFRYGLKDDAAPRYNSIDPKDGELPISIEVDVEKLQCPDPLDLHRTVKRTVLRAVIHVGMKYRLPIQLLEQELELIDSPN